MASKPKCKYGEKCYRKSDQHLKDYNHPISEDVSVKDDKKTGKKRKRDEKDISSYFTAASPKKDKGPVASPSKSNDEPDMDPITNNESPTKAEVDSDVEDVECPSSPGDIKENIKQKFLVDMPKDFYHFWTFCSKKCPKCPCDALKDTLGFTLVGPFDVMAGKHKKSKVGKKPNYMLHWRYYYDPPEFMTVIRGDDKKQYHLGYFRDEPSEMPVFVAANSASESGMMVPKGDNLFAAVKWHVEEKIKSKSTDEKSKKSLQKLSEEIEEAAEEHGYNLELKSKAMKARDKKVVCKSFHGAGLMVPVDDNGIGYREVPETVADLKKMFKAVVEAKTDSERETKLDPVQELITLVQFANDECDYGEGFELGMDMFTYGGEALHTMIVHLLPLAYQLLGRDIYAKIIESHLKHRRRGLELSQI